MTTTTLNEELRKKKIIAIWLLIGVFMIVFQIVTGGVTRLTGSGLSMTEWDPIMGAIPPLNDADWQKAFEGYKDIAQFKYINNDFTISDFKFIFFWEWFHRLWARTIGVVFVIPFIYFLVKKYITKEMITPLIILFGLGIAQAFIGWYMVQSGLGDSELVRVSHIRLAVHLLTALGLLAYTLWFALQLLIPQENIVRDSKTRNFFLITLVLLTIQLAYGAFMSGLLAALIAPSWPTMNGYWIPPGMTEMSWLNSQLNVQFIHRLVAYLLFFLVIYGSYKAWKLAKASNAKILKKASLWPMFFVVTQVLLGIFTVISVPHIKRGSFSTYETLAQTHQVVGMLLLISVIVILYLVRGNKSTN
ncbi:MAG: COX15/CtaA family protein [Crocinitomicaceae bacterium]|nr:COX15/CtaA family protein [Crocinitomicaceae bacterium]